MDYVQNLGYCSDDEHHYYATAKAAFNALNAHQRSLFTSNSAYLTEWTRLSTWASKNGDSLNDSNQLAANNNSVLIINTTNGSNLLITISLIGISLLCGYFFLKQRKED